MPDSVGGEPVLGIAEDTLAPRGFEPTGTFSVTGPPMSGKTNAMRSARSIHAPIRSGGPIFHIGGRRAQLADAAPWVRSATTIEAVKALAKEIVEVATDESYTDRIMVVVEDVPQFADSEAERQLKELFQTINRSDHFLIGDADISQLSKWVRLHRRLQGGQAGHRAQAGCIRRRLGVQTAFPKVKRSDFPEGRGIFVQSGRIGIVQIPLMDGPQRGGECYPWRRRVPGNSLKTSLRAV